MSSRRALAVVLALLFVTGWAANHFTAMLPVLARDEGLGRAALDGAFGIYAVGLLPGLLGGGTLSDRFGRRVLLLSGAGVAAIGNFVLLCWHDQTGIFVGRLVVGMGVGAAMSAGTAWSADLGGGSGSALAGVLLSAGFGCGPVVSGLLAEFGAPTYVPFAVTVVLSVVAVSVGLIVPRSSTVVHSAGVPAARSSSGGSAFAALSTALPLAVWVFACATTAMVTMVERMHYRFTGSWLPGVAAAVTLTTGVAVQMAARRWAWGPRAGVVGALAAGVGFGTVAAAGASPSLVLFLAVAAVFGVGYGLCLRQGLVDIETLAPTRLRGTLTGIFYTATYLGFGLPVLLVTIEPSVGIVAPMVVLAVLAVLAAGWRMVLVIRPPKTAH